MATRYQYIDRNRELDKSEVAVELLKATKRKKGQENLVPEWLNNPRKEIIKDNK